MRTVIQRAQSASVVADGEVTGSIGQGLFVLLGIEDADTDSDIEWLCQKVINLRIFNDAEGVMNRSVLDIGGEILLVSQFTLYASTRKGNRPSYIRAARPPLAVSLYEKTIVRLSALLGRPVATGIFGADMQVSLVNDGPVTIIIDTKQRE